MRKWFHAASSLEQANAQLRGERARNRKQLAQFQNDGIVARSAEALLSARLFKAELQLTEIRRALGITSEYQPQVPRAFATTALWPHEPLDNATLSSQCFTSLHFSIGGKIHVATSIDHEQGDQQL